MTNQSNALRDAILGLIAAYPRQAVTPETVALYRSMLSDIDPAHLTTAIRDIIHRSKWFPSVAEIRDTVDDLYRPQETGIEAWATLRTFRAMSDEDRLELRVRGDEHVEALIAVEESVCPESQNPGGLLAGQSASARARFIDAWDARNRATRRTERRALLGITPDQLMVERPDNAPRLGE